MTRCTVECLALLRLLQTTLLNLNLIKPLDQTSYFDTVPRDQLNHLNEETNKSRLWVIV